MLLKHAEKLILISNAAKVLGRMSGQEEKLQLLCSPVDDEGLVLP